jgi:hypothetical protein
LTEGTKVGVPVYKPGDNEPSGQVQDLRTTGTKPFYFLIASYGRNPAVFCSYGLSPGDFRISGENFRRYDGNIHSFLYN